MSDLAATSCGCNSCDGGNSGCSCIIWIILILCFCGGNNGGCGFSNIGGCFGGSDDGCGSIIWIILILLFCGGFGNNNSGCGCNNSCC